MEEKRIQLATDFHALAECIDQRSQVIQFAIQRATEIGNGVTWRDLLPPHFFGLPSIYADICNVELSGNNASVQVGNHNQQHNSLNPTDVNNSIECVNAQINQGQNVNGTQQ